MPSLSLKIERKMTVNLELFTQEFCTMNNGFSQFLTIGLRRILTTFHIKLIDSKFNIIALIVCSISI